MRALYVRLKSHEHSLLREMAADERRDLNDQAAHLISQGLARWQLQRDFEASLPPMADDDPIEAGVA